MLSRKGMMAFSKKRLENNIEIAEDVATKNVCTEIRNGKEVTVWWGQPLEGLKCKAKMNSSGEAVTGLNGEYNKDKWRTSFSGGFMTDLNGLRSCL